METNLTRNHEVAGLIPGLPQWVTDLAWLWLWRRPAAVATISPPAWEPPYAGGEALKRKEIKGKISGPLSEHSSQFSCFSNAGRDECCLFLSAVLFSKLNKEGLVWEGKEDKIH